MSHNFHPSIIRAYDIRGVYQKTLFDKDAFFVGKSFSSEVLKIGGKKVAVACDGRKSSPALKSELIKGLIESGIDVFDVGVGPTPMLYFSVYNLDCDAGIMVTGSHNPKDHNGFKMMLKNRPFFGEDIINLKKIAENGDFVNGNGSLKERNIFDNYVERLLQDSIIAESESGLLDELDEIKKNPLRKKLKIAWDAGNGSAGEVMSALTSKIDAENILLFADIDGDFPNHHPDPTVAKNLQDLIATVLSNSCDIGIAFDGDGDRIGVVDDEGEIIWGDQLMVFYARDILQKEAGSTVIADVKASNVLFEEVRKAGGNAIMWKTGHSFIKAKMKETNAALAGEMSGHIFFADEYYGFDDALYAAIRIINILAKSDLSLSQLRKGLVETFSTPEIRVDCLDERKFLIVDELKNNLKKAQIHFNDVDGIRVENANGWWLIRPSNTQPVLVARAEATSKEGLNKLKLNLKKHLEFCQVEIPQELEL